MTQIFALPIKMLNQVAQIFFGPDLMEQAVQQEIFRDRYLAIMGRRF